MQAHVEIIAPAELVAVGTVQKYDLGTRYEDANGNVFRYGKFDATTVTTVSAADPVGFKGTTPWVFSADQDTCDPAAFVGIAMGSFTATNIYGWVQVAGIRTGSVSGAGGVAAIAPLYWSGDAVFAEATIGSHHVVAINNAAIASGGADGSVLIVYSPWR